MTYLEYVKIVCPELVYDTGFVQGCPEVHGLPGCNCKEFHGDCVECYACHEIPDDVAFELMIRHTGDLPEWVFTERANLTKEFVIASDDEIEEILEGLNG